MRYFSSASSVCICCVQQTRDGWGTFRSVSSILIIHVKQTREGQTAGCRTSSLSCLYSSALFNEVETVKQTDEVIKVYLITLFGPAHQIGVGQTKDDVLKVYLIYTHRSWTSNKRRSYRRMRLLRSISLHSSVLDIKQETVKQTDEVC